MIRFFVCLVFLVSHIHAIDLTIDQFHGLQKQLVLGVEHPIDIQETVGLGFTIMNGSTKEVSYTMLLIDPMIRRYVGEDTSSGLFYSFGVRYGSAKLRDGGEVERETAVMPYYDIGLKGKFNRRWFHVIKIEAGYFMLFTNDININSMLGLHFTPFFSFGYTLDPKPT